MKSLMMKNAAYAVLAIAAAKNPRAIPWIMEALDHEQDLDVQGAMIFALGAAPTEDGIAPHGAAAMASPARPGDIAGRARPKRTLS